MLHVTSFSQVKVSFDDGYGCEVHGQGRINPIGTRGSCLGARAVGEPAKKEKEIFLKN